MKVLFLVILLVSLCQGGSYYPNFQKSRPTLTRFKTLLAKKHLGMTQAGLSTDSNQRIDDSINIQFENGRQQRAFVPGI